MKILDFIKKDVLTVEYYGAKKPKYRKDEQAFFFENDTLVALSSFDNKQSLKSFYSIIKEYLIEYFNETEIKDYTNKDLFAGFAYLDKNISLNYQDSLNLQTTSIALIEAETISFNYILIRVVNTDNDEALIWVKLKSPLKIENNTFVYTPTSYQVKIDKDGLSINNYPAFNIDLSLISFIKLDDSFYILDRELYQKYFNLDSYYFSLASDIIYNNDNLISDGQLLTKGHARLICDYFEQIDLLTRQIQNNTLSNHKIQQVIDNLNLQLELTDENKFLLKKPSDLMDLLLLSCGCLGINVLNDEIIRVKRPQYLDDK